jgi:hypothetical protein
MNGAARATAVRVVAGIWAAALGSHTPAQEPAEGEALDRLQASVERAEALVEKGDLPQAREEARAAWEIARDLASKGDERAQALLWRLGHAALQAQGLRTARDAWLQVVAHREAILPDDHRDLQAARHNLAVTKLETGDAQGALALLEKVFEVCSICRRRA